jgi:hypothetical protein
LRVGARGVTDKEVWEYVTRTLTNLPDTRASKIDILDNLPTVLKIDQLLLTLNAKEVFFKRAESLGTDGGDTGYSITHGNHAAGHPLYSRVGTAAVSGYRAYSYSPYNIDALAPLPLGFKPTKRVFEAYIYLEQLTNTLFWTGPGGTADAYPTVQSIFFIYDSSVSPNWLTRTYVSAEEKHDTGVAAKIGWVKLRFEQFVDKVDFYIDDVLVSTHASQVPDMGYAGGLGTLTIEIKTLEAASKYFRYAYVGSWVE